MADARVGQGRLVPPAILTMICLYGALVPLSPLARAESLHTIVVTATRTPEPEGRIPIDISVVSGETVRDLDAHDMATALSLVPGVEAPAGGDAGPSSAVPSFWGLHEFDAFLLVVDGVPWGGAFNPAIPSLDLTDVERIEVMKGSAPVMFGATSFVGEVACGPSRRVVDTDRAATVRGIGRSGLDGLRCVRWFGWRTGDDRREGMRLTPATEEVRKRGSCGASRYTDRAMSS